MKINEIWIKSNDKDIKAMVTDTVLGLALRYPGDHQIKLYIEGENLMCDIAKGIQLSADSIPALQKLFGTENVKTQTIEKPDMVIQTSLTDQEETNKQLKRIADALETIARRMNYPE
jgi:hypothetical protein